MLTFQKYKCVKCKENFLVSSGGVIYRSPETICPKCGSSITIPIPTLK